MAVTNLLEAKAALEQAKKIGEVKLPETKNEFQKLADTSSAEAQKAYDKNGEAVDENAKVQSAADYQAGLDADKIVGTKIKEADSAAHRHAVKARAAATQARTAATQARTAANLVDGIGHPGQLATKVNQAAAAAQRAATKTQDAKTSAINSVVETESIDKASLDAKNGVRANAATNATNGFVAKSAQLNGPAAIAPPPNPGSFGGFAPARAANTAANTATVRANAASNSTGVNLANPGNKATARQAAKDAATAAEAAATAAEAAATDAEARLTTTKANALTNSLSKGNENAAAAKKAIVAANDAAKAKKAVDDAKQKATDEMKKVADQVQDAETAKTLYDQEVTKAKEAETAAKKAREKAEEDLAKLGDTIKDGKKAVEDLDRKVDDAKNKITEAQDRLADLQKKLDACTKAKDALDRALAKILQKKQQKDAIDEKRQAAQRAAANARAAEREAQESADFLHEVLGAMRLIANRGGNYDLGGTVCPDPAMRPEFQREVTETARLSREAIQAKAATERAFRELRQLSDAYDSTLPELAAAEKDAQEASSQFSGCNLDALRNLIGEAAPKIEEARLALTKVQQERTEAQKKVDEAVAGHQEDQKKIQPLKDAEKLKADERVAAEKEAQDAADIAKKAKEKQAELQKEVDKIDDAVKKAKTSKHPPHIDPTKTADVLAQQAKQEAVAKRIGQLEADGHGPQRHGDAITEKQLNERGLFGINPETGTQEEEPGVTTKVHRANDTATKVRSNEDYVLCEAACRQQLAALGTTPPTPLNNPPIALTTAVPGKTENEIAQGKTDIRTAPEKHVEVWSINGKNENVKRIPTTTPPIVPPGPPKPPATSTADFDTAAMSQMAVNDTSDTDFTGSTLSFVPKPTGIPGQYTTTTMYPNKGTNQPLEVRTPTPMPIASTANPFPPTTIESTGGAIPPANIAVVDPTKLPPGVKLVNGQLQDDPTTPKVAGTYDFALDVQDPNPPGATVRKKMQLTFQ